MAEGDATSLAPPGAESQFADGGGEWKGNDVIFQEAADLPVANDSHTLLKVTTAFRQGGLGPVCACQRRRALLILAHHHLHDPRIEECVSARRRRSYASTSAMA